MFQVAEAEGDGAPEDGVTAGWGGGFGVRVMELRRESFNGVSELLH